MADDNSLIPISDEQAKLGQEALKLLQGLGSFFGKALGSVPEDLIGLLGGDYLRARRVENMMKMMFCAKERLEARGVKDTKPASLTLALPILRGAADESREELRDLWARLLASAMDPSREKDIRQGFAEAIGKMDPLDARVLAHLRSLPGGVISYHGKSTLPTQWGISVDELLVSLSNLSKIGMTQDAVNPETGALLYDDSTTRPGQFATLITPFGREFLRLLMD
ncbi:MAG: Abi-alpha family protein [Syntrophobacteraceae bacterium]